MSFIDPDGIYEYSNGYATSNSRTETEAVSHDGSFQGTGHDFFQGSTASATVVAANNQNQSTVLPYSTVDPNAIAQNGTTTFVRVTGEVQGSTTVRAYPFLLPGANPNSEQLFVVPYYAVYVAGYENGEWTIADFEAIRFGVSDNGTLHVQDTEPGRHNLTWWPNVFRHGGWHMDGAPGFNAAFVHEGPSNWGRSRAALIGCVAIGGRNEWNRFNNFIDRLNSDHVSINVEPAATPPLIRNKEDYEP